MEKMVNTGEMAPKTRRENAVNKDAMVPKVDVGR